MIDLSPQQFDTVKELLARHVPDCEVRAFGSRVKWTAKSYSDLDLVVMGAEKLKGNRLERLREAFIESDLPFRVDVMDWHATSEQFRKIISNQNNVVQDVRNPDGHPANWKYGTLGEIANIVMGQSPPGETCNEIGQGVALLNGPTEFGGNHPQPVQFTTNPRKFADPGDLLFCVRGSTTGRMNWADRRYAIGRGLAAIQPKGGLDCRHFVRAVVNAELPRLLASATGSTFPNLSREQLDGLKCLIPPLAEQKAIASILGALDDKIELNRRMNATLEAMARALFQSWFVDFDPVRAKLDGRQPQGMDKATAALFPDSFQDSAAGRIPKGWKVGALDDLTSFVIGGDWGATEPTDAESVSCYCIRGADIPSLQEGGVGKMPTRFLKRSSVEKRQLMDGDLAIEISGGSPTQCTGRPVLVSDGLLRRLGRPLVASNFCRIVKLKSPAFSRFVYCWLRSLYDAGSLFQFETGTTGIKNFAFVLFSEKYPLVVPEHRVAEAFYRAVSPFFARIQANAHQSRTLATLRDTLLPKLLSGELSVAEA